MKILTQKSLLSLSIILLILASVIAINSPIIWVFNSPNPHPGYFGDIITPNYYSQINPSKPMIRIHESFINKGTFYSPTKVMYANITLQSHDLPSVPLNATNQDNLTSVKIGLYFGLYKVDNSSEPTLLSLDNLSITLNRNQTSFNKLFYWSVNKGNNLLETGSQRYNVFIATALLIQEEFVSHKNGSSYYYSGLVETSGFLNFHHTANRQIVVEGINSQSKRENYTSHI